MHKGQGSRRLFLDADGVLADFDAGAKQLLGAYPREYEAKHGRGSFWKRLASAKNFYGSLPKMADADLLFEVVKHLKPTILTGLPLGNWAAPQKVRWAAEHFPGVPIITCMARDKPTYCEPGDVLVDDQSKHREPWADAGGVFILHRSAAESIPQVLAAFEGGR